MIGCCARPAFATGMRMGGEDIDVLSLHAQNLGDPHGGRERNHQNG